MAVIVVRSAHFRPPEWAQIATAAGETVSWRYSLGDRLPRSILPAGETPNWHLL